MHSRLKANGLFFLLLIPLFVIAAPDTPADNLIVEISNGKLRGKDNSYYYSYESIPYAEAPVGSLRFVAPKAYTQKWDGIFDATQRPPRCMQWDQFKEDSNKLRGVEDCLTVSVYKPKTNEKNDERFPVLAFIHGGAFMFGSAKENGHEHFMRSGRVILVKISYRLGPLGFLSTEDDIIPGNNGLKDQRLALEWIKENIEHFGGDPEEIMVLGFSAGAASVHFQMMQKSFENIAKVAVSISASALTPWAIVHNSRARAFQIAKNLNCSQILTALDVKTCLQSKPAEAIVRSVTDFLVYDYIPFTTFGPVIESRTVPDAFLTQLPADIITSGDAAQVPWLVSYTTDEGGYNAALLLKKMPRREELIETLDDRWYDLAPYMLFYRDTLKTVEELDDRSMALKRQYLGDKQFSIESYYDLQRMFTDVLFKNNIEQAVLLHREHTTKPVFAYRYDNPAEMGLGETLSKRNDIKFGTVHGDDFFLIFNSSLRKNPLRPDEMVISEKFIKMLEDFVQNSDKLSFGSCEFVDNVGRPLMQLMHITKDTCENEAVNRFP